MPTLISGSTGVNKITDGTIVNADIASGAAIDGSKINSSFGKVLQVVQFIDASYSGTTSTSYVTTTLTKNITAISSTSKFLVTAAINGMYLNAGSTGAQGFWKLAVNGGDFSGANTNHHSESGRAALIGEHDSVTLHMLDTVSKTAGTTHTYAVYLKTNGNLVKYGDTAGTSAITIMEIES